MLTQALNYWSQLQPYRSERRRCKDYTYGKQWKDIITTENGRRIPEEQYIREQGSSPLKNNLLRRIVRNVIGVFRNNYQIPTFKQLGMRDIGLETTTDTSSPYASALEEMYSRNVSRNALIEVYSRVLEEYLIGGMAVVRKRLSTRDGGAVYTDIVRPSSFFFNTDATDPRGWDIHTIGEIHRLRAGHPWSDLTTDDRGTSDLYGPKVIEIWTREGDRWRYRFLAEDGATLAAGDSPFPCGGHPYVMKAYPFIDGEIHSFIADCLDQQRYINRLITLNDWIIRGSAKGVLLFPESAIPDDLTLDDIAAQWSLYNGVIRYKARTGVPLPQQVAANATNVGISELLEVQLKMMEDVSGINPALQGQLSSGSVSGALYEQQTRHALTGLTDILEGFRQFMEDSSRRDLELLTLLV